MTIDLLQDAKRRMVAEHQIREKVINEEFKVWKKTVPLLYDTIRTQTLEFAPMTIQFFPDYIVGEDRNTISVSLVYGTNTLGKAANKVQIMTLEMPSTLAPNFHEFYEGDTLAPTVAKEATFGQHWIHPTEVNRLKVSQDGLKIAAFDTNGSVHIYTVGADLGTTLNYHSKEGYSLEWLSEGSLLSGSHDAKIALWDINTSSVSALFETHTAAVNDVGYNVESKVLFGSVSDDYSTQIHDVRAPARIAIEWGNQDIQNALAFHPLRLPLLATGGKDNIVSLFDLRNTKEPFRKLFGHNDTVDGVQWDATEPSQLHSWALDRRVHTWELLNLNEEFVYPGDMDGRRKKVADDPCLLFVHGGHTNRVNDLAIHPTVPKLYATVGDDSLLEVYKPKTISEKDIEEDERGEGE